MKHRIPSLDGLRTISIGFVLLLHMSGGKNFLLYTTVEPINPGALGVPVFFVISGYLITRLLLKELSTTGTISLKKFYIRRSLRILPAYWFYIGVVLLLSLNGFATIRTSDFLHALTFTTNYSYDCAWYLGHTWSLSVEEQFYLLWPVTLFLVGRKRGMIVAAATILIVPLIRFSLWTWVPSYHSMILHTFETTADHLAAGCLLAGIQGWLDRQNTYLRFLRSPLFILVPMGILAGSMSFQHPRLQFLFGVALENLSICIFIDRVVRFADDDLGRLLNSRLFVAIGVLSYSLYLWQQLFCRRDQLGLWTTWFPLNLALSLTCAALCFYLVEKPILRLRDRFKAPPSRVPKSESLRGLPRS